MKLGFDPDRRTGLVVPGGRRSVHRRRNQAPLYKREELGPWRGCVVVEAWEGTTGDVFRVIATWTGPPIHGAEPSPVPVSATDLVDVDDPELAQRVAAAAADQLAHAKVPNLLALAGR